MDLGRFTGGGGDVDRMRLNNQNVPDYYDLPLVGGLYITFLYPEVQLEVQHKFEDDVRSHHNRLRRQMSIPDCAFDPTHDRTFLDHEGVLHSLFTPLTFSPEFIRNNRLKHLNFQRRLDILVKKSFLIRNTEIVKMVHGMEKDKFRTIYVCVLTPVLGFLAWYLW
ncbi:uncharacterized protein LOC119683454 [Teleopsis dalmanni]|uniref:uncharacterized protein LOC119683454 n=1 Tax=Teleopsis dalmanni TaxID=139649 RepID=UPI0018CD8FB9|nr:uncharacterized protein LOC119683454 [Teleopsis dalmanni]